MLPNYNIDNNGVIHQIEYAPFVYDAEYVDTRYAGVPQLTDEMSHLRLGFIRGAVDIPITSILDVGYGTGDFLRLCKKVIPNCYGNDLFKDRLPKECEFVDDITAAHYDMITFFDSLEHFEDIDFIGRLKCNYVAVSVPWCHNLNDEWFANWKHRRPDEHLHHFEIKSLNRFMEQHGFELITYDNVEDIIRKPTENLPNILTAVFRKKD
jgi:hypothetical protein